ncbi:MAG: response regulator [Bacteroidia bacterium]
MKILLVEDEPFMLEAISSVIENTGSQVIKADNVNEAKKLLDTDIFGLVITDLYLPEPDGFAFVNYIKENPKTKSIPVVVVTGMVEHKETLSKKVPADAWISKPFSLDQLLVPLKKYLEITV